jgi:uncharacterized protein YkwD
MTVGKYSPFRIVLVLLLALAAASSSIFAWAADSGGYKAYVQQLMRNPPKGVVFRADLENYLSQLASQYRQSRNRSALVDDPTLRDAARAQAIDMMLSGRSSHLSSRGESFTTRFSAFVSADNTAWASGENAASDRHDGPIDKGRAKQLFQLWLDSTGHRKNMLNGRYVHVSTGAVQRGDELWSVQIFWSEPIRTNLMMQ